MCNFVLLGYNSCCLYHDLYRWRTRTKFGERAFSYAGPAVWNLLPDDLRRTPTINSFKRKLKTYLFISAFSWFYFSFSYYVLTFVLHRCPYFCNRRTINYLWYDMIWYDMHVQFYVVEFCEWELTRTYRYLTTVPLAAHGDNADVKYVRMTDVHAERSRDRYTQGGTKNTRLFLR